LVEHRTFNPVVAGSKADRQSGECMKVPSASSYSLEENMARKSSKKTSEEKTEFSVSTHVLVPQHELCSEEEKRQIFERYKVQPYQLPRITAQDPAIRHLGVKIGDLIRITRRSETAGEAVFYRIVSSE
jgi:DNA-directed RNA polymerase subunit H